MIVGVRPEQIYATMYDYIHIEVIGMTRILQIIIYCSTIYFLYFSNYD